MLQQYIWLTFLFGDDSPGIWCERSCTPGAGSRAVEGGIAPCVLGSLVLKEMRFKKQGGGWGGGKRNMENAVPSRAAGHVREQSGAKHPPSRARAHGASHYVMPKSWAENCIFTNSPVFYVRKRGKKKKKENNTKQNTRVYLPVKEQGDFPTVSEFALLLQRAEARDI